ncbi:hypothetical protein Gotri_011190, partial [Gossypium trilobum]|nr:hypothetical protein [Gossypium trilobum]
ADWITELGSLRLKEGTRFLQERKFPSHAISLAHPIFCVSKKRFSSPIHPHPASMEGNLVYGGWESFNYPTDTILSSQIYWSNENTFIKLEANGVVTQDNGATLVSSDFNEQNKSRRLTLDDDGNLKIQSFDIKTREFTVVWLAVQEMCTVHGTCGDNAICMNDASNTDPTPHFLRLPTRIQKQHQCQ